MSHIGHDIARETAYENLAEELDREPTDDEVTDYIADATDYYYETIKNEESAK